jgi:death-on-curing protein
MTEGGAAWDALITVDEILALHAQGLREHGGLAGPANPEPCIEAALGGAHNAELYVTGRRYLKAGLVFASHAFVYLALRHCFTEGNKRAAWGCCTFVLAGLNLGVTATPDEVEALSNAVLAKELDGIGVAHWLASRLYALG